MSEGRGGHATGDLLLAAVARRLAQGLSPSRVFRSGGDEYMAEIVGAPDRGAAERLAKRISAVLGEPFEEIGTGLEARVGITLQRIDRDAFAVWARAQRAADGDAVRLDAPCVIDDDA